MSFPCVGNTSQGSLDNLLDMIFEPPSVMLTVFVYRYLHSIIEDARPARMAL